MSKNQYTGRESSVFSDRDKPEKAIVECGAFAHKHVLAQP